MGGSHPPHLSNYQKGPNYPKGPQSSYGSMDPKGSNLDHRSIVSKK